MIFIITLKHFGYILGLVLCHFHLETGTYAYHKFIAPKQTWVDLGAGFILGYKFNKHLGVFMEGKYNKYWNRQWHDFSVGLNYIIF